MASNDPFGDDSYSDPEGTIRTSRRLRVFWLTRFRGYKVSSLHRLPKESTFGELYYKNSWVLVKRSDDGPEDDSED